MGYMIKLPDGHPFGKRRLREPPMEVTLEWKTIAAKTEQIRTLEKWGEVIVKSINKGRKPKPQKADTQQSAEDTKEENGE